MKNVLSKYLLVIALIVSSISFGQEKESDRLKREQKELENKIGLTQKLLENTKDSKHDLTGEINLLERKIQYRKDLRNNLQQQLIEIQTQIYKYQTDIDRLEVQISQRKYQYKLMIIQAYKMRDNRASLIFILSSESLNQANKRMAYLEQIRKFRADQIQKIYNDKYDLQVEMTALKDVKFVKDLLVENQELEQNKYIADREHQKKMIKNLDGKEQQLKDELLTQKKKSKDIQNAINAAINKEILADRKNTTEKPKTFEETKEVLLNTKNFEDSKGKLPWPVTKGEITKGFGKQPHPAHPNVYTYNNGIDITTIKGSTVRAVYAGVVSSVVLIPGAGKAVIIAHGDYRTIYSNLQETYVTAGQAVGLKHEIGSLLTNPSGNSAVHFEIRKITEDGQIKNINPTYWLYK